MVKHKAILQYKLSKYLDDSLECILHNMSLVWIYIYTACWIVCRYTISTPVIVIRNCSSHSSRLYAVWTCKTGNWSLILCCTMCALVSGTGTLATDPLGVQGRALGAPWTGLICLVHTVLWMIGQIKIWVIFRPNHKP